MEKGTYLFAADVSACAENPGLYARHFSLLPEWRKQKAQAYAQEKDRRLSVGVYALFDAACASLGLDAGECQAKENGALEAENYHVSFSHSGSRVFVAISSRGVGCDVEEDRGKREVPPSLWKGKERAYLASHPEGFYRAWTLKESLGKYYGIGLSGMASLPEIDPGQTTGASENQAEALSLFAIEIEGYHYACVSRDPVVGAVQFLSLAD